MENNIQKDPVVDLIERAGYIAVMPSTKGGVDPFCAGAGLYNLLKEKGKKVAIIYSQNVPDAAKNLLASQEIYKNVTERDLLVSVDYSGTPAAKMNYEVENEVLMFRLGPVTKDYDLTKIRSELIGHDYDLIFTVGVRSLGDLGDVYNELRNSFQNGQVVNLDINNSNTRYAKNNLVDTSQDSLSLMILNIATKWGLKLTSNSAKSLLTGIAYKNDQKDSSKNDQKDQNVRNTEQENRQ